MPREILLARVERGPEELHAKNCEDEAHEQHLAGKMTREEKQGRASAAEREAYRASVADGDSVDVVGVTGTSFRVHQREPDG